MKRILVADDDAVVRDSLSRVLELEGYGVIQARDGHEALTAVRTRCPGLLLLDLNMPSMDGWRTLDLLAKDHPLLPVVVITARPNQYQRALGAGVDALMEKPLDFPTLLGAIARLLEESSEERLLRLTRADFATLALSHPNS
jgi:CheY-like chemotaxis protein